jgi:AAA domain
MRGATKFEPRAETPTLLRFFSGTNAPPINAIEWLVRGLLACGAITILAGQPGVSKSVHSFILAGCLCLGRNFAGMKIEQPCKVLYLDIDGGWAWSAQTLIAAMLGVGLEGVRRAGTAILILDHTNKAARAWFMTRAPIL